jgi:pyruvate dehydrogenase E1 component alpha subunit
MLRIRRFEELIIEIYPQHTYIGRQHLYIGHEATAAGVALAMNSEDLIFTTHRCHGYVIARDVDLGQALAEVMGREGGTNRGRGGPWHIADQAKGIPMTSAQLGGGAGLGVGAAFGYKRMKKAGVSVVHMGDGTFPEGIAYEALNMASVFALPVLFVCENNAVEGQRGGLLAVKSWDAIPRALSIHCEPPIDGRDVEAVHECAVNALTRIREKAGPVFMQCDLAVWPGSHLLRPAMLTGITNLKAASNPELLTGDHSGWSRDDDPVLRTARSLLKSQLVTEDDLAAIDRRVGEAMAKAKAYAEESPFPDVATVTDDVFAGGLQS